MSNLIESYVENVALGLGKNPSTTPFFRIPSLPIDSVVKPTSLMLI